MTYETGSISVVVGTGKDTSAVIEDVVIARQEKNRHAHPLHLYLHLHLTSIISSQRDLSSSSPYTVIDARGEI